MHFSRTKTSYSLVLVALASALVVLPGAAFGARARAAGNEPESAAGALYSVVKSAYSRDVSGRSIETQCSGRKSPYSCTWWIIKGSKERRKSTAKAAEDTGVLLRSGEGSAHNNRSRVYKSGYATASYNSKTGGFSIKLG